MRVAFERAGHAPYDYLLLLNEYVELVEDAIDQLLATERHLRASRGLTIVAGAVRETVDGLRFDSGVRRRRGRLGISTAHSPKPWRPTSSRQWEMRSGRTAIYR
jgi:hypothetical protein